MGIFDRLFSMPPSKDTFAQQMLDGIKRSGGNPNSPGLPTL